jgi:hypothetical protein
VSAFGVLMIGFGVLLIWSGLRSTNVRDVLHSFYPPATAATVHN